MSEPRVRHARTLLLVATAGMGVGMALLMRTGTAIGSRLFMDEGLPHPQAVQMERGLAALALAAALALFLPRLRTLAAALLLLLAATLAWATVDQGGHPFTQWAFASQAMRMAAPLAVLFAFASVWDGEQALPAPVRTVLYASTAVVFVMHGIEALRAHPWFVDLTITAVRETVGTAVSQRTVERMLLLVGVVDIASAVALVTRRSRAVALWMAAWGGFTATLRVVAYGSGALGDMLVRTPHALLPLALAVTATRPRSGTGAHPAAGTGY